MMMSLLSFFAAGLTLLVFLLTLTKPVHAADPATDDKSASQHEGAKPGIIAPGATLKKLAGGFVFTEGPACDTQGNVYFTDQPNNSILKWNAADGTISTFLHPCGRSNGLCFDDSAPEKGDLYACADEKNELWRIAPDGKATVVITHYDGKLLNGPNDVWVRPGSKGAGGGGLYLTDPYYKRDYWKRDPALQQDTQGVYYLAPGGTTLTRLIGDMKAPNGIIGTPDGKTLYVADINAHETFVFDIQHDGSLTNRRLFCHMGSDGMTIDSEGNVYLTGNGVTIFDKSGEKIEHIPIAENWTGNVCFGGKDRHLLFITASTSVYGIQMRTHGVGSQ